MFSKRLQYLRRMKGMNQHQLAYALSVSASTIGMYEQGRRMPGLDILISMSQLFDVSLDYLVTGSEHSHSDSDHPKMQLPHDCPCCTCYWKEYISR